MRLLILSFLLGTLTLQGHLAVSQGTSPSLEVSRGQACPRDPAAEGPFCRWEFQGSGDTRLRFHVLTPPTEAPGSPRGLTAPVGLLPGLYPPSHMPTVSPTTSNGIPGTHVTSAGPPHTQARAPRVGRQRGNRGRTAFALAEDGWRTQPLQTAEHESGHRQPKTKTAASVF